MLKLQEVRGLPPTLQLSLQSHGSEATSWTQPYNRKIDFNLTQQTSGERVALIQNDRDI